MAFLIYADIWPISTERGYMREKVIMLDDYKDVLTIDEVAEILRVNRKTVRAMLDQFNYRKIGRIYRISKMSVARYIAGEYTEDAVTSKEVKNDR